jgi:hypothetical protein
MNVDTIREALHRRPFRPFSLLLADGQLLHVAHEDLIAISPRRVVVINPHDESMSMLEPTSIVSIEPC